MSSKDTIEKAKKTLESGNFFDMFSNIDLMNEMDEKDDDIDKTFDKVKEEKKREKADYEKKKNKVSLVGEKVGEDRKNEVNEKKEEKEKPRKEAPEETAPSGKAPVENTKIKDVDAEKMEGIGRTVSSEELEELKRKEGSHLYIAIPKSNARSKKVPSLINNQTGEITGIVSEVFSIGKDAGCDMTITGDKFVSRQHAEIRKENGEHVIRDLESTNGTFVNGERISERVLKDKDRIKIADVLFSYEEVV